MCVIGGMQSRMERRKVKTKRSLSADEVGLCAFPTGKGQGTVNERPSQQEHCEDILLYAQLCSGVGKTMSSSADQSRHWPRNKRTTQCHRLLNGFGKLPLSCCGDYGNAYPWRRMNALLAFFVSRRRGRPLFMLCYIQDGIFDRL